MKIVCLHTILMKYHSLFFRKLGKMSQNLSSAAVVIGALRVKILYPILKTVDPGQLASARIHSFCHLLIASSKSLDPD